MHFCEPLRNLARKGHLALENGLQKGPELSESQIPFQVIEGELPKLMWGGIAAIVRREQVMKEDAAIEDVIFQSNVCWTNIFCRIRGCRDNFGHLSICSRRALALEVVYFF